MMRSISCWRMASLCRPFARLLKIESIQIDFLFNIIWRPQDAAQLCGRRQGRIGIREGQRLIRPSRLPIADQERKGPHADTDPEAAAVRASDLFNVARSALRPLPQSLQQFVSQTLGFCKGHVAEYVHGTWPQQE